MSHEALHYLEGPNFGVSHNLQPRAKPLPSIHVSDDELTRKGWSRYDLNEGFSSPPHFVIVVSVQTSPDKERQIVYFLDDGSNRGVINHKPWSGREERMLFRSRTEDGTWKNVQSLLPERTYQEQARIIRERDEAMKREQPLAA